MQSVEEIAREIVAREGGYVDDPDDPGGATKYGVTIGTMQGLGLDLNRDGRVDGKDVRALTRAQAEQIFVEHYFRRPRLSELPEMLQPSLFDMYVNAGRNAVKILQRLITRMGFAATDDGIVGPPNHSGCRRGRRGRARSPGGCLWDCAPQLLLRPGRSAPCQPKICHHPQGYEGRLDHPGRSIHPSALSSV